jgi:tetratricopeptide (TPR) repeat protein
MRLLKEIRPLIGNYNLKSGVYHYYRNEFAQAVDYLRKALRDERSDDADRRRARHYLTLSWMDSARRLESRNDLDGAIADLRRAAESSPGFPDIHYRLGRLLEGHGKLAEAVTEYDLAIENNANYLDAHIALGFCLIRSGDAGRASETFRAALALKLASIQDPFEEGLRLLQEDDTDRAAEPFHEAFLAVPRLSEEFIDKALNRLRSDEFEEALIELDRALELNPNYPDLHNYRGIALCELKRDGEAIEAFRRSADLSDGFVVPRLNLAFTLIRAEDVREAEAELESILDKDPTEAAARAALKELRTGRRTEKRRPVSRGTVR